MINSYLPGFFQLGLKRVFNILLFAGTNVFNRFTADPDILNR